MGNGYGKIKGCFTGGAASATSPSRQHHRHDIAVMMADQALDEGLGHSFCYVRPTSSSTCIATAMSDDGHNHNQSSVRLRVMQSSATASSKVHSDDAKRLESSSSSAQGTTTFRSISGASVSANTSTALTAAMPEQYNTFVHRTSSSDCAAAFESTDSFTAMPLQPVPRTTSLSGPLSGAAGFFSGPLEQAQLRGFLSGPLERAYMSGPLDRCYKSGPIDVIDRSLSAGLRFRRRRRHSQSISRLLRSAGGPLRRAFSRTHRILSTVVQQQSSSMEFSSTSSGGTDLSAAVDDSTSDSNPSSQNLQWAQGKAGEDRVHVVVSDDYGWLFVGIYDGFNGPDAPDYLLSNLYRSVHKELGGLMSCAAPPSPDRHRGGFGRTRAARNWKPEWKRERVEVDKMLGRDCCYREAVDHGDVLKALSRALSKTEEAFLDMADRAVAENPELALMGSCVLVMLMMGEDVYVLNVGDSRAVLAQQVKPGSETVGDSLQRISEETAHDMEAANFDDNDLDADRSVKRRSLGAVQLTRDHSTSVDEEVKRIEGAHLDDVLSIVNDRVKGSLKVTRAFGAGYLKQPKWNDALLEVFRIDYVGTAPYITCTPDLRHHRLGPEDHFLILSSDGLYQYFTNEEVVNEVEWFMDSFPDGDPAQHLVEEVLFRAAKKAGMDFHELLEIPQGDRRKYHDDVSVMVVSLEGRIWRSSV